MLYLMKEMSLLHILVGTVSNGEPMGSIADPRSLGSLYIGPLEMYRFDLEGVGTTTSDLATTGTDNHF
jgi:hypothetical protein